MGPVRSSARPSIRQQNFWVQVCVICYCKSFHYFILCLFVCFDSLRPSFIFKRRCARPILCLLETFLLRARNLCLIENNHFYILLCLPPIIRTTDIQNKISSIVDFEFARFDCIIKSILTKNDILPHCYAIFTYYSDILT